MPLLHNAVAEDLQILNLSYSVCIDFMIFLDFAQKDKQKLAHVPLQQWVKAHHTQLCTSPTLNSPTRQSEVHSPPTRW